MSGSLGIKKVTNSNKFNCEEFDLDLKNLGNVRTASLIEIKVVFIVRRYYKLVIAFYY